MPRKLTSETLTDDQLEELAAMGLTDEEIGNLVGLKKETFRSHYPEIIKRGRARLRQSLRKAQIAAAIKGNASMLIWLGKVYLNQRDSIDHAVSAEHKAIAITPNVLERLQTSYKLTMEQLRTRGALPMAAEDPEGGLGDREGVSKTVPRSQNSGIRADAD